MPDKEKYNPLCQNAISSDTFYVHVYDPIKDNDGVWFFYAEPKCYFHEFATVYHLPEEQEKAWEHIKTLRGA